MLKINWSIEPGDGTGCSIADAKIRNNKGICATLNCNNQINQDTSYYYFGCKFCNICQKPIEHMIKESWNDFNEL